MKKRHSLCSVTHFFCPPASNKQNKQKGRVMACALAHFANSLEFRHRKHGRKKRVLCYCGPELQHSTVINLLVSTEACTRQYLLLLDNESNKSAIWQKACKRRSLVFLISVFPRQNSCDLTGDFVNLWVRTLAVRAVDLSCTQVPIVWPACDHKLICQVTFKLKRLHRPKSCYRAFTTGGSLSKNYCSHYNVNIDYYWLGYYMATVASRTTTVT